MRGRRPPRKSFSLIGMLGVAALSSLLTPARAQGLKTLSGRWQASAMRSAWSVGDWTDACGPKPTGGAATAGPVTIKQQGGELSIEGAGKSYSTTQCWEQFPGLIRTSHSGGQRGWQTVCSSAASDPRQTRVVTRVMASDDYITFDETGQYQFVVKGQNCTASVRRSRSFRLIQREGEPAVAVPGAPTTSARAKPQEPTPKRCTEPGEAARLEVRPSRKLMRPGEEFTFRALVLDASGCALGVAPNWRVVTPAAPIKLLGPGKVKVEDAAAESELTLSASVGDRSLSVVVEVASKDRYDALLQAGNFTETGESTEAAVITIASRSVGGRSTVVEDASRSRRKTFVAVVGGAALLLGLLGLILVLRSRRRGRSDVAPLQAATGQSAPPPPAAAMICPTCRTEYPLPAQFCENDGNRLVPFAPGSDARGPTGGICPVCGQGYDPGVSACPKHLEELVPAAVWAARAQQQTSIMICPVCGTQYPGDGRFCGSDGAALVPVN